jgi:hypothetical protein
VSIGEGGAENIATVQDAADLIEKVKAAEWRAWLPGVKIMELSLTWLSQKWHRGNVLQGSIFFRASKIIIFSFLW